MVTRKEIESDYLNTEDIATEFSCSTETARRWIDKYFDRSAVEVMGGRYYVHKNEVQRWRERYGDVKPVRGRRLRNLPS